MKKTTALLVFVVIVTIKLSALGAASPTFRADDGGLWHVEDNPALLSVASRSEGLKLGLAYDFAVPDFTDLLAIGSGEVKASVLLPFFGYYGLTLNGNDFDLVQGSGVSFGRAFAFGYDCDYSSVKNSLTSYALGFLLRPTSFLSIGITGGFGSVAGTDKANSYKAGLGLALRPLALFGDRGPSSRALTLSADGSWSGGTGFSFENVGLRLLLSDLADLHAWYSPFPNGSNPWSVGVELRLALGSLGFTALSPALPGPDFRVAEDLEIGPSDFDKSTLPSSSLGRRILVIKDLDEIGLLPVPDQGKGPFALFASKKSMSFPDLVALLERARADRGVEAIAFENLPSLGGFATYQEFSSELATLRKAGKKVYFYGDYFGMEYAILAGQADGISVNPNGAVGLSGLSFHRAYMKPLFDNLGIRFVNLAPWETKSAYNDFTESAMPAGEAAMMRRFYGDIQDQMSDALAAGRGAKLRGGAAASLAEGPYLLATEALSAGLVDSLAYVGEFEENLRKTHQGAALVAGLGVERSESWDGGFSLKRRAAVVWLSGSIGLGKGRAGEDIGFSAALEIERLRKDPSIAGIVLEVDSPGGAVMTSDLIAREVRLAVESGKPVVVSMGRYAASGGYYISAPASRIVAEPATVTGSIGVTGLVPNISETLRKIGINYDGFDLSPGASMLDPAKKLDEAELARMSAMIHAVYDRFVEVVAEGRKMDAEAVRKIGEGRIWSGREALKLGLVDELGGLAEAKAWLEAKLGSGLDYTDVIPGERSLFPSAFGGLGAAIKDAGRTREESAIESLAGPLAARLKSLLDLGQAPLYYLDAEALGF